MQGFPAPKGLLIESGENGKPKLVSLVFLVYLACLGCLVGRIRAPTKETRQTIGTS
jgi:hypothetical protein